MKKDLLLLSVVAALVAGAFLMTAAEGPAPAPAADIYRPPAGIPVAVKYRAEAGLGPIVFFEITIRGPGDCPVRFQVHDRPVVERTYPVSEADFENLLERLARADFFSVESVPRSGYHADSATIALALTIGDQQNEVTIDGRRRPSRDLTAVLDLFDGLRKAATPEPIATGD